MLKNLRFLFLAGALLFAGCSGDEDGTAPNPSIAVSLGGTVTVVQGQSGSTTVTVTRGGGFSGAVALTAANLPAGVTAAFDPASVPAGSGSGSSTLTLTAAANAATGAATYNVTANGGANLVATTNGSVTVNAAPDFTLTVAPPTLSVPQGAAGTANITITRAGGFAGAVNLSVANLPTGVTAAFDNAAPTGNAAILTLTVAANAAVATTNLTINGAGTPGTRSAALGLTVTAPPSGFTLAANPATVAIVQGVNGQSIVTISKTGSFTGAVALSVTGLPANVTAAFDPVSASAGADASLDVQTTSTLTLTVGGAVAAQNYPLVIHGQAEGQPEATTNLTLTVTAAPVNGFTLAIAPTTVSAQAGATGQTTVTISKTGTFTSNVALSVLNLPTGVTAAFNPASASAGKTADVQTTSTLTLTVDAAVAPQNYDLTVRGSFTDFPNSDVPLTLTVTAAAGDYSLSVNPASLSVPAGQSGAATVTISKTGSFTGNVTLSAVGLPANVTASFNPPAASPPRSSAARDVETTSTMTLTVGAGVTPNNYAFQIKGVAEGEEDKLLSTSVTVAAPPGPGNGNLKFCDLDNLPVWFAYQDGNDPWTQVTGSVAGDGTTYTFNITQSTGAYSYVVGNVTDGFTTTVLFGTQAQLIGNAGQCVSPNATRTLNGSVTGIGAADQVSIAMGGGSANASIATSLTFQLENVLNGPSDLIAVRNSLTLGPPPALTPLGVIIRRGLNIADNGTIPALDFGAAEAFAPQTAAITLANLGGDTPIVTLGYQTPTTVAGLSTSLSGGTAHTVHGIPAARQDATDLHQLTALAASGQAGDARGHLMWFKTLADKTVTLGPVLTAPTIASLGNAPYPRYSSSGPIQAEYDDGFSLVATQVAGSGRAWSITATRGYFAAATYTLLMPDMSAAGYQPLWALQVGAQATLNTSAYGFSTNGFTEPQVEGGFGDFATRIGQVTP